MTVFFGLMIPFLGTTLGAACVFFLKNIGDKCSESTSWIFASGVMVAASVWSLLIHPLDLSASMGRLAFVPACGGLFGQHGFSASYGSGDPASSHGNKRKAEGQLFAKKITVCWYLAVLFITFRKVWRLSVVLPACWQKMRILPRLRLLPSLFVLCHSRTSRKSHYFPSAESGRNDMSRGKAFLGGMLSGVVEPLRAFPTITFRPSRQSCLVSLLRRGAMLYVVVRRQSPRPVRGERSNIGTIGLP